jgi:U1 small nuclear ribonucleoprotein 70kDa
MTDKLPPNLLALFAPRPPLRYLPPGDHAPEGRRTNLISGVAAFLPAMKEYEEIPYDPTESWLERKIRVKTEKREKQTGDAALSCTLWISLPCFAYPPSPNEADM